VQPAELSLLQLTSIVHLGPSISKAGLRDKSSTQDLTSSRHLIWLQGVGTECVVCGIKLTTINKRCGVRKGAALRLRSGSSFLGLHFRAASASHHRALYRVGTRGVQLQPLNWMMFKRDARRGIKKVFLEPDTTTWRQDLRTVGNGPFTRRIDGSGVKTAKAVRML
jgi:hypothetical protein